MALSFKSSQSKLKSFLMLAAGGTIGFGGLLTYKGDERFYAQIVMPALHKVVDAETSHEWAIKWARKGWVPSNIANYRDSPILVCVTIQWSLGFHGLEYEEITCSAILFYSMILEKQIMGP